MQLSSTWRRNSSRSCQLRCHRRRLADPTGVVDQELFPKTAHSLGAVATGFLLPLPLAFIVPWYPGIGWGLIPPVVSRLLAAWRHRHRTGQAAAQ